MKTAFKLFQILWLNSPNTAFTLLHVTPTPHPYYPSPHHLHPPLCHPRLYPCHPREGGDPAILKQWGKSLAKFLVRFYILLDSRLRGNDTEGGGNVREEDRNAMLTTFSPFALTKTNSNTRTNQP